MRRRARSALVVSLALTAPLAACSAITGFSGLVGDGAPVEAGTDARAVDGSVVQDGAAVVDGASAQDAGPPIPFCADAAGLALCDDFDGTGEDLMTIWGTVFSGSGSSIGIDKGAFLSPPASLLATNAGGGGGNRALVQKTFTGHTRVVLGADIRLESFEMTGYGALLEIHLSPYPDGFSDYRTALIYTGGKMTLDVYAVNAEGGNSSSSTPIALDFSQWQRISVELAMTPMPHTTAYDRSGTVLATLPLPPFAGSDTNTGQYVMVGLTYLQGNSHPWSAHEDNVTVMVGD